MSSALCFLTHNPFEVLLDNTGKLVFLNSNNVKGIEYFKKVSASLQVKVIIIKFVTKCFCVEVHKESVAYTVLLASLNTNQSHMAVIKSLR